MAGDRDLRRRWRGTGCGLLRRRCYGSGLAGTPLLQWKFHVGNPSGERRGLSGAGGGGAVAVSVRKLAASLWQLDAISDGSGGLRWRNGLFAPLRLESSSMANLKFEMEGSIKRNSDSLKTSTDCNLIRSHMRVLENRKTANISVVSAKSAELLKARNCIKELEAERGLLRRRLKCFVKKLNEEKALWMRREYQEMFAILKNLKDDMKRERRKCEKMESANSKLRGYVADSKLSIRRFMQKYEKEKKARESLEDTCYQLGNKIEENRAEMGDIWNKCVRIREEIEEERKMLQTAEIWREERAKMKLVDAKLILEHKYCHMNNLLSNLEEFLRLSDVTADSVDMSNAKDLEQASVSINIEETKSSDVLNSKETSAISQNSQIYEVVMDLDHCIRHDQELNLSIIRDHVISLEANDSTRKISLSNSVTGGDGGLEDASVKDTVIPSELCSIQALDDIEGSVSKIIRNKHNSSCQEEQDNKSHRKCKKSDSSGSSSISSEQSKKKGSSICKIQRTLTSNESHKCNTVLMDRVSNGSIPSSIVSQVTPHGASNKEAILSHGCVNQWPSTEPRNPHIVRAMKGSIKWPKGIQRNGLKAKLEKQKMLLRNALKQKTLKSFILARNYIDT